MKPRAYSASEMRNCSLSFSGLSHLNSGKVGLPTAFQEKSMFLITGGMITCPLQESAISSSKARKHCMYFQFFVISFFFPFLFGRLETCYFTFQLQALFPVCTFYESLYFLDCFKGTQSASRLDIPKLRLLSSLRSLKLKSFLLGARGSIQCGMSACLCREWGRKDR